MELDDDKDASEDGKAGGSSNVTQAPGKKKKTATETYTKVLATRLKIEHN